MLLKPKQYPLAHSNRSSTDPTTFCLADLALWQYETFISNKVQSCGTPNTHCFRKKQIHKIKC